MIYGSDFYTTIRAGVRASAAVVVPTVLAAMDGAVSSVVDVGCGEGWWGSEFAKRGIPTVLGVDGPWADGSAAEITYLTCDLTDRLPKQIGTFDLAVSLEVAEHLPQSRADSFVDDLCCLAPDILFSAAIPGQGGTGHVNEQPPGYWVDLFERRGYSVSGALRWMLWNDDRVENWYRQNLLFASTHPGRYPKLFGTPMATPWHVIHPILFDARRPQ